MHRTPPLTRSVAGALLAVAALAASPAVPAAGAPPKPPPKKTKLTAPFDGNSCGLLAGKQLAAVDLAAPCKRLKTLKLHGPLGTFTEYPARYGSTLSHWLGITVVKASNASLALSVLKAAPNETLHKLGATGIDFDTGHSPAGHDEAGHAKPDHRWAMVAFLAGGAYACGIRVEDDNGEPTEASLLKAVLAMVKPVRAKLK